MAAFDSLNQFILFSSASTAQTRAWSRYDGLECGNQEKLKYTVLKNPRGTVATPVVGCASSKTTVDVAGRTYGIDPSIFLALKLSLQVNPVFTLGDLRARIAEIRALTNRPAPLAVQLIGVPLARYKTRLTYLAGGSNWREGRPTIPRNFRFKVGSPIDTVIENFPLIALYEGFFNRRKFIFQNAQYVYVGKDDGCGYTGRLIDLDGTASQNGSLIKSSNGMFRPLACIMQPASVQYPIKFGLLVGINVDTTTGFDFAAKDTILKAVALNSELIFIPAQTQIEMIENKDLPYNMGVTFPLTNGGNLSPDFLNQFNKTLSNVNVNNSNFKTLRPNVPLVPPQITFSQEVLTQINTELTDLGSTAIYSDIHEVVDAVSQFNPNDIIIGSIFSIL